LSSGPGHDPNIFDEPFYHLDEGAPLAPLESDLIPNAHSLSETPDQVVWDEPAIRAFKKPPKDAASFSHWYMYKKEITPDLNKWMMWGLVALLGGPMALLSALAFGNPTHLGGYFLVIVIAPILEEIAKVALALVLLESKPYMVSNGMQIVLACMLSGFFFGSVENLLYLHVYIPDPSPFISTWRWSVCTAMHTGTTTIASLGLLRAWRYADEQMCRPPIHLGFPLFATAMIIHGSYNTLALILEYFQFFN
jgi:hypothetical protein